LHNLTSSIVTDVAGTALSDSSRRPTHCAGQAIERLHRASVDAPDELRGFYADTIATLQRIWQAHQEGLLPEVLIHGDCWPGNAVLTSRDGIAMIDWDCAGVGPAILDVGYLLLTCHLGKPQLPAMQPDEKRIAAVVHGYRRVRELSSAERSVLKEAILYDVARRTGLDIVSSGIVETWREDIRWQKMLARHAVSAPIAEIAGKYFAE
ncbi:MAG: phosphotransferase, partial [Ktedonobacteraceae bacterium]|nr:phosphotransferase [Ktedonobacteraceae bacterium]